MRIITPSVHLPRFEKQIKNYAIMTVAFRNDTCDFLHCQNLHLIKIPPNTYKKQDQTKQLFLILYTELLIQSLRVSIYKKTVLA